MYPIALIALTGIYLKSKDTNKFILPFTWLGLLIAVYHNLIYYKVIEVIVPCNESAPCTAQQINYLGFITIPLLSLVAFSALLISNLIAIRKDSHEK